MTRAEETPGWVPKRLLWFNLSTTQPFAHTHQWGGGAASSLLSLNAQGSSAPCGIGPQCKGTLASFALACLVAACISFCIIIIEEKISTWSSAGSLQILNL